MKVKGSESSQSQDMNNPVVRGASNAPQNMGQEPRVQSQQAMQNGQYVQRTPSTQQGVQNVQSGQRAPQQRQVNTNRQAQNSTVVNQQPQPNTPRQRRQIRGGQMQNNAMSSMPDGTMPNMPNGGMPSPQGVKKKPPTFLFIGIGVVVLIIALVIFSAIAKGKKSGVPVTTAYEKTGRYVLDLYQNALLNHNREDLDVLANTSYIAKEWDYANGSELRNSFINSVCSYVKFEYPKSQAKDAKSNPLVDANGSPITVEADMLSNETITATVVDYEKIALTMEEDRAFIQDMYKKSKLTPEDYIYKYKMADLMIEYILSKGVLPTKTVDISIPIVSGDYIPPTTEVADETEDSESQKSSGVAYKIDNDAVLDDLLFGSEAFHNMEDTFSKIATNWTGKKMETYMADDWVENPEYTEWHDILVQRMEADGGKFTKKSTWEPWYLRDENNNFVYDENGEKVVNYYSIKDENGNDWIQPDEKIMGKVEKEREVDDPFVPESSITYVWCGANFIENEYTGKSDTTMQIGDGSKERPAGVGTEIVTVVLGDDGKYHDVKVTLTGYWIGKNAIDYSIGFSEKNRGFDNSSVVKLITYEVQVENLDKKNDITIDSEMYLADENSNQSARTGTMYGFYGEKITIPAGKITVINDWATSTELERKYVCWGKSFGRNFPTVWFKVLAGNGGVIETYDATASTVNKHNK